MGLVSGACFSDFGLYVTCSDNDAEKIERLNKGIIPIYEPGLSQIVEQNLDIGRLKFTTDNKELIDNSDIVFIAVGTPNRRGDGYADLRYIFGAVEEISGYIDRYKVIVTKSTVPVGTCDEIESIVQKKLPKEYFDVVSNPEFLKEGDAINDFKNPDRIVIGSQSERAFELMYSLYRPLYPDEVQIVNTDRRSSELIKYSSNAFLATKIAFINEISDLCEVTGANVQDVARGMGLDRRIGPHFLHPGPGYGGSCFPKDTMALSKTAQDFESPITIVDSVIRSNNRRKRKMIKRIAEGCGGSVDGKTIAVLGLTFKPNTDDMRRAPSLEIIPGLQKLGARIRAYDPEGMPAAKARLKNVQFTQDAYTCITGADVAVILTEWDEFRALDLGEVSERLRDKLLIDLRNIYTSSKMVGSNLKYMSIGKREINGINS